MIHFNAKRILTVKIFSIQEMTPCRRPESLLSNINVSRGAAEFIPPEAGDKRDQNTSSRIPVCTLSVSLLLKWIFTMIFMIFFTVPERHCLVTVSVYKKRSAVFSHYLLCLEAEKKAISKVEF